MTLSLAEAQALLAQRRAELGIEHPVSSISRTAKGDKGSGTETAVSPVPNSQPICHKRTLPYTSTSNFSYRSTDAQCTDKRDHVQALPPHLGWHSVTLSQHLRARQDPLPTPTQTLPITPLSEENPMMTVGEREPRFHVEVTNHSAIRLPSTDTSAHFDKLNVPLIPSSPHIRLHPSLAMAWLKAGLVAPARVWLLLRHLDKAGCGWLGLTAVRQHLTNPDSPFCLCGKRQLRNLLKAGDGLFWVRDSQRIWLRGVKKMCGGLTAVSPLRQIRGQAVSVPLLALKNIKTAKAHFYASFHSSRNDHRQTEKQSNLAKIGNEVAQRDRFAVGKPASPIARDTLTDICGVSHTAQRRYERLTGIQKQVNYAVGSVATPESRKTTAYQKGYAAFVLTDVLGKHGKPNQKYNAWQLPNSYSGPHQPASNGRKKNINSYLNDLSQTGMTGNKGMVVGGGRGKTAVRHEAPIKSYYDGKSAARPYNRGHPTELYWAEAHSPYWYHDLPLKKWTRS